MAPAARRLRLRTLVSRGSSLSKSRADAVGAMTRSIARKKSVATEMVRGVAGCARVMRSSPYGLSC